MKVLLIILFLLTADILNAQDSLKFETTANYLKQQGIKLNTINPPPGFKVYYNCDSLLFLKGIFGDTIKIWTSSIEWYCDLEEFKKIPRTRSFGLAQIIRKIEKNGRIAVPFYRPANFIYRNDSLFEIKNSNSIAPERIANLESDYSFNRIDLATFITKLDSFYQIEEKRAVYIPKLIFVKNKFKRNKKIKLSEELNFESDTIVVEDEWIENGKTCYFIRINNKQNGQRSSYAYAINEDMKFLMLEGCNRK